METLRNYEWYNEPNPFVLIRRKTNKKADRLFYQPFFI